MKRNLIGAAIMALALAACGGDDGGSAPPPTGGGGNTPTPSSSPSPTYQTFAQLTGTQTFGTTCGGFYNEAGRMPLPVGGIPFGSGITIVSDRSQPNYNISSDGTGLFSPFSTAFTQDDRDTSVSGEAYSKVTTNGFTERFAIFALTQNGVELPYVRATSIVAENFLGFTVQNCALGIPTQANDVPAAQVNYAGLAILGQANVVANAGSGQVENYRITGSQVSLIANPTTGVLDFRLELRGRLITGGVTSDTEVALGTYTGQTTIDGTAPGYTDRLVNAASNSPAGTFGGGFFGPQGDTAAVSFTVQESMSNNNVLLVGALVILRPS